MFGRIFLFVSGSLVWLLLISILLSLNVEEFSGDAKSMVGVVFCVALAVGGGYLILVSIFAKDEYKSRVGRSISDAFFLVALILYGTEWLLKKLKIIPEDSSVDAQESGKNADADAAIRCGE